MPVLFNNHDILMDAEEYVRKYLDQWLPASRYFHGIQHTQQVVEKCETLAAHYELPWHETEALLIAAWFHDIGYCYAAEGHEERSITILLPFLSDYSFDESFIQHAVKFIRATKKDHQPTSLGEKIIRDADYNHLASRHYPVWSQMLRQELELCEGQRFATKEWTIKNIKFFEAHHYHTEFANDQWNEGKHVNLATLIKLSE